MKQAIKIPRATLGSSRRCRVRPGTLSLQWLQQLTSGDPKYVVDYLLFNLRRLIQAFIYQVLEELPSPDQLVAWIKSKESPSFRKATGPVRGPAGWDPATAPSFSSFKTDPKERSSGKFGPFSAIDTLIGKVAGCATGAIVGAGAGFYDGATETSRLPENLRQDMGVIGIEDIPTYVSTPIWLGDMAVEAAVTKAGKANFAPRTYVKQQIKKYTPDKYKKFTEVPVMPFAAGGAAAVPAAAYGAKKGSLLGMQVGETIGEVADKALLTSVRTGAKVLATAVGIGVRGGVQIAQTGHQAVMDLASAGSLLFVAALDPEKAAHASAVEAAMEKDREFQKTFQQQVRAQQDAARRRRKEARLVQHWQGALQASDSKQPFGAVRQRLRQRAATARKEHERRRTWPDSKQVTTVHAGDAGLLFGGKNATTKKIPRRASEGTTWHE